MRRRARPALNFELPSRARARSTDPPTSWQAAASIAGIRDSQAKIYSILLRHGPLHDEAILPLFVAAFGSISPSGCRSRRAELVDAGLVQPFRGEPHLVVLPSGRSSVRWAAIPITDWQAARAGLPVQPVLL